MRCPWMWDSTVSLCRDPEYRGKYQRPQREEDYRNPKPRGLKYETSDRGLALVENLKVYKYIFTNSPYISRTYLRKEMSDRLICPSWELSYARRPWENPTKWGKISSLNFCRALTALTALTLRRSRMKPNSAHKVYAWRDLLEERELKSQNYSCTKLPSEVFLPDKTAHLLTLFHKEHQEQGKVKRVSQRNSLFTDWLYLHLADEWLLAGS